MYQGILLIMIIAVAVTCAETFMQFSPRLRRKLPTTIYSWNNDDEDEMDQFAMTNNVVSRRLQAVDDDNDDATVPTNEQAESAFDDLVNNFVRWLDSKDLGVFLNGLQTVVPPIDATPGLNTLTKWLQRLPPDVKEELTSAFPETVDFPTAKFWQAVDREWQSIREQAHNFYDQLDESGTLTEFREAAKRYNEVMEWTVDLPFAIYDSRVAAFRNATKPLYDARTEWLRKRDAALESALRRQRQMWEPAVNASEHVGERITEKRDRVADAADKLFLHKLSSGIFTLRSLMWRLGTDARYAKMATMMCALNPVCCENPAACLPVEMNNRFNK